MKSRTLFTVTFVFCFLFLIAGCSSPKAPVEGEAKTIAPKEIIKGEFQVLFDSAKLQGAILIFDPQANEYYSNDFSWAKVGRLPASTFKIPNSIIALETGVVENENTVFKWDGKKRRIKNWEQDLNFHDAFHFSCVPCYQEIARKVGVERMKKHLADFNYGNMVVDSATIDLFWLEGESKINSFQQIDFLQRFVESKLPISERTEKLMKTLMVIEDTAGFRLSGKTGWAIRDSSNNGWFVGFVEAKGKVFYFATNVSPGAGFDMNLFAGKRKEITYAALRLMKVIGD